MARTLIARGHTRDQQRRAAERKRDVRGVKRDHAAMPERRARADDPRPRTADRRIPTQLAQPVVQGAGGADRLLLATERRSRGEVIRE